MEQEKKKQKQTRPPNKFHPSKLERLITDVNELILLLQDPKNKTLMTGKSKRNKEDVLFNLHYLKFKCREFLENKNIGKFEVVYDQHQAKRNNRKRTKLEEMKI
jgi:hypothetical protein